MKCYKKYYIANMQKCPCSWLEQRVNTKDKWTQFKMYLKVSVL